MRSSRISGACRPSRNRIARTTLRFPYDTQAALAVWRILFFRQGEYVPDSSHAADWNRGAYLVRGLGHCGACHGERNVFGATRENLGLSGGLIPMTNWYAPSLTSADEAGVAQWERAARRRTAEDRHLAARLDDGSDGGGRVPEHAVPDRG